MTMIPNDKIWFELKEFAIKASGERKTQVAACLIWPNGQRVFGANRLNDNHGLTEQEIADRIRPKFYDAMKCGEPDAIDKAIDLGLDLTETTLYTLMLPCPRCADKIAKTKIKNIVAMTHRTKHNGKFDNPLEYTQKVFDKARIKYKIGKPDER